MSLIGDRMPPPRRRTEPTPPPDQGVDVVDLGMVGPEPKPEPKTEPVPDVPRLNSRRKIPTTQLGVRVSMPHYDKLMDFVDTTPGMTQRAAIEKAIDLLTQKDS